MYKQFGIKGHAGIDFGCSVGTKIFAPCDGIAKVVNDKMGYGLHIKLRSSHGGREVVLGHFSKVLIDSGRKVNAGDPIGFSGNTGYSTGPHLHLGLRFLKPSSKFIFEWRVKDYNNGYLGYINFEPYVIKWKGTLMLSTL